MDIDFTTACVSFDCARCNGSGIDPKRIGRDPDWCIECGGPGFHVVELGTWLRNLATAAGMARAFAAGWDAAVDHYDHDCGGYWPSPPSEQRMREIEASAYVEPGREGSE